jgi:transketolase
MDMARPADGNETAAMYKMAVENSMNGSPTTLALSRQVVPNLAGTSMEGAAKGAYVVQGAAAGEACDVILIGTGTELELACQAGAELESKGKKVRVVSMPCWEAFERQPAAYQESVLPAAMRAKTVSIEAGTTFGWAKYAGASIGHDDFGASAPAPILYKQFGITADAMAAKAMSL